MKTKEIRKINRQMIKTTNLGNAKKVSVVKLPFEELKYRLNSMYRNTKKVRNIINLSYKCYSKNGLYIKYDKYDDLFVVITSNPEYRYLAQKYCCARYSNHPLQYNGMDMLLFKQIKNIKKIVENWEIIKNRTVIIMVMLSLVLNTLFSVLWANKLFDYSTWFIVWAIAQIIIIIFSVCNITRKKGTRYKSKFKKSNNKTIRK